MMEATLQNSRTTEAKKQPDLSDEAYRKKLIFWDGVSIALKTTGLLVWLFIFLLALLEIKRYTNFDLIPGYDSAVDDVYGAMRGGITNAVGRGK